MKPRHIHRARAFRRGFSLIETVLAASISVLMLASLFTFLLGSRRLLHLTFARTEFALQARQLRDHLLFHSPGAASDAAGLLSAASAPSLSADARRLRVSVTGLSKTGATNVQQLALSGPWRQLDYSFFAPGTTLSVSNRFYVNIVGAVDVGGLRCVHGERVVVPLFGRTQPTAANQGGDL